MMKYVAGKKLYDFNSAEFAQDTPVTDFIELGNKTSGSIKREFLDRLKNFKMPRTMKYVL
jgi:hypothetical protein